ncbi:Lrp/AsnC family transcriptional regulator [Vibrio alginolyticus]|uniref:Lrp/AsnC family transcriptional regulator n=1 Tax=Vibrio sp. B1FLJ16 TaxID=2751178 RepID=UPI0015F5CE65|nr:Lrp/AsnC family transcriptional regulator [Vibrio sp. B1FLJ16]MCA0936631.1 Lrp/AsnC family transcriptional regulator [Vibrio alginolyticus]CAD7821640.1 AsnC-type helix-turn-helix domain [Vibrio sp. B1FLJ16]CAD7823144.1 AsnC-type helix-turn-helix domain [Vibrio sp. B1FLJ16]CAE6946809.1 AsnC-type helix-turn-helix domain [Vibrio sp. B1FLJ16]CAE6951058.1 AsnC-type helix-turn-helix domain [Vibrio sp. B1FLJ16]
MRLDRYDVKILQILHDNGRITKSHLAEEINLSVSPCWERVKKLEQAGIIEGYGAKVNTDILFKKTSVMVEVSLKEHNAQAFKRFEQLVRHTPEVTDCYATGGGIDYILKIQSEDIDQYQRLIDNWLDSEVGIERYFTYIVTKTIKRNSDSLEINQNALF